MPTIDENTAEWIKIATSVSVPVIILIFGYLFNIRLKSIDHSQWQNRKIIELRLDLYKEIAPKINSMFCFCLWIGEWKNISPYDMIRMKRETDKIFNVYRYLLNEDLYNSYNIFIHHIFKTYNGPGEDAKIKSYIYCGEGDRRVAFGEHWQNDWDNAFFEHEVEPRKKLIASYNLLMEQFRKCVGLEK